LSEYQQKLRSLTSELSFTEERERRRIAEGLHDDIAQPLALSLLQLGALRSAILSPDHRRSLDKIHNLIDGVIQSTQSFTFKLSPPVLYELEFHEALE